MEVVILEHPDRDVIGRGSYFGGPDDEFLVASDGQVYFQVVGDTNRMWAGPSPESFRQIAAAWNCYQNEVRTLLSEKAQLERVNQMRRELEGLGALPTDLPRNPEPLWSLLVFEAENGLV